MSGFVGIFNLDGAPVARELLERLTDFLAFRGPDARGIWRDGPVGFGHTLLKTTFESERERQPVTLDGEVWITGDARVDGRAELIQQLAEHGVTGVPPVKGHGQDAHGTSGQVPNATSGQVPNATSGQMAHATNGDEVVSPVKESHQGNRDLASAPDIELILHAYHAWGIDSVDHLLGDFAFAIWDGRERRLFCARDQMGVKPFYYAQVGNCVVFSNTLDCVRRHPAVSSKLNDAAIADFLLAGSNENPATTTFADIQRLPPAHTATWSPGGLRLKRYWTLPIDEPLIYPNPDDYPERFRELLRMAVSDRLRTDRLGIYMSGGLDSSGLAATACELGRERPGSFALKAFTAVYDHAIPDQERYYAGLVAKHVGIPIHFTAYDQAMLTPWSEDDISDTPEPVSNPHDQAAALRQQKHMAAYSRVLFYGEGPDNALGCEWRHHLTLLAQQRRYGRMLPDLLWHVFGHPRIPFVGRFTHWRQGYRRPSPPAWLNPDFAARLDLGERWRQLQAGPPPAHPTRPKGYRSMAISLWQDFFEGHDLTGARTLSEVRHPYIDIRFLRFLLAVPAIPWCCNKYLVRRALRNSLPIATLRRPKSPLARDPNYERARHFGAPEFPLTSTFLGFVNPHAMAPEVGKNIEDFRALMHAVGLAFWLKSLEVQGPSTFGLVLRKLLLPANRSLGYNQLGK